MTTAISAFMAEVQAAQEAQARVPELTRMIDQLSDKLNEAQRHNQALELRAKDRESTISDLNSRLAKMREERDDASFRELEAQDRLATLVKAIQPAWAGIGSALNAVNPPKPESVAEPVKDQSVTDPTVSGQQTQQASTAGSSPNAGVSSVGQVADVSSSPEGQSASPPAEGTTPATAVSAPAGANSPNDAGGSKTYRPFTPTDPWQPSKEMPKVTDDIAF